MGGAPVPAAVAAAGVVSSASAKAADAGRERRRIMAGFLAGKTGEGADKAGLIARMRIGTVAARCAGSEAWVRATSVWTSIRLILESRGRRASAATLGAVPETILKRRLMKSRPWRCVAAMTTGCAVRLRSG